MQQYDELQRVSHWHLWIRIEHQWPYGGEILPEVADGRGWDWCCRAPGWIMREHSFRALEALRHATPSAGGASSRHTAITCERGGAGISLGAHRHPCATYQPFRCGQPDICPQRNQDPPQPFDLAPAMCWTRGGGLISFTSCETIPCTLANSQC